MTQYHKIDSDGYYIEPVIIYDGDEIPDGVTDIPPPQPCYLPRFDRDAGAWVEDAPKPKHGEDEMAVWDGEAKAWSIVPVPEPPPDYFGFLAGLMEVYADGR